MYPLEKSGKGTIEKNGKGVRVILCLPVNYFTRIDLTKSTISKNNNGITKIDKSSPVPKILHVTL